MELPWITLPETNSKFAPENGWLQDQKVSFWGSGFLAGFSGDEIRSPSYVGIMKLNHDIRIPALNNLICIMESKGPRFLFFLIWILAINFGQAAIADGRALSPSWWTRSIPSSLPLVHMVLWWTQKSSEVNVDFVKREEMYYFLWLALIIDSRSLRACPWKNGSWKTAFPFGMVKESGANF